MSKKQRFKGRLAVDEATAPQIFDSLSAQSITATHNVSSSESSRPVTSATLTSTFEAAAVTATTHSSFDPSVVKIVDTSKWPNFSPDPSGLAWRPGNMPGAGTLLASDSEIDETPFFRSDNLFYLNPGGGYDHSTSLQGFCKEPTGLAYVASTQHLFISDDDQNKIFEIDVRNPGLLLNSFSTQSYATDCEDVAYDPTTNHLLILNGSTGTLNLRTIFETTTTGQIVRTMVLPSAITDPEAIACDPVHKVLYVAGSFSSDIFVVSRDGTTILDTITVLEDYRHPITGGRVRPKALTLAPSSDPNDPPGVMSLRVADYGKDQVNDGRLFEIQISRPVFTAEQDTVNFNQVGAWQYYNSPYNALAGDDMITLATDTAHASRAGFDPAHSFNAGDGNDVVIGRALSDRINGGIGDDFLRGGGGNDRLSGDGNTDTLSGGVGNDTLDGGSGSDTVDYQESATAVTVTLALGTATGNGNDTLINIENVVGSNQNDMIRGNAFANVLNGSGGNDTVRGGEGDDMLAGAAGTDRLFGESGNDMLRWNVADCFDGGSGFDTLNADLPTSSTIDLRGDRFINLERIRTGGGADSVTLCLNDVLSDTADDQFIANLGSGSDTLRIDISGGWVATAPHPTLGSTAVSAGVSVAGMSVYSFTDGHHAVTVFTNAEVVHAQILPS